MPPTYLTKRIEAVAQNTPNDQPAMTSEAQCTFKTTRLRPTAMTISTQRTMNNSLFTQECIFGANKYMMAKKNAADMAAWPLGKLGSASACRASPGRARMKKSFKKETATTEEPIDKNKMKAERHFFL